MPRLILIAGLALVRLATAQDIVDLRGGLLYHTEACVFLDAEQTKPVPTAFYQLREGETLVTGEGFAEVLIGMGNVLRIGPQSRLDMVTLGFRETLVALRRGSAVFDGRDAIEPGMVRVATGAGALEMTKRGEAWIFEGEQTVVRVEKGRWRLGEGKAARGLADGSGHGELSGAAEQGFAELEPWNQERSRAAVKRRVDRMRDAQREDRKGRLEPPIFR